MSKLDKKNNKLEQNENSVENKFTLFTLEDIS